MVHWGCNAAVQIKASQFQAKQQNMAKLDILAFLEVDDPGPPSGQAAQSLQPFGNLFQSCQSWAVWHALCVLILASVLNFEDIYRFWHGPL